MLQVEEGGATVELTPPPGGSLLEYRGEERVRLHSKGTL